MTKIKKKISFDLDLENHKMLNGIIKKTGESKVELLRRLIAEDHKRITNRSEIILKNEPSVEQKKQYGELIASVGKVLENIDIIREGENKIFCSILNLIKDQFRLNSFIVNSISQTSLLQPKKISIIKEESDRAAADFFSLFYNMISSAQPVEIVELLKKK